MSKKYLPTFRRYFLILKQEQRSCDLIFFLFSHEYFPAVIPSVFIKLSFQVEVSYVALMQPSPPFKNYCIVGNAVLLRCCFKMQPNFVVVALVQTVVLMRCIALLTKAIVVRIRFEQRAKLYSNIWCIPKWVKNRKIESQYFSFLIYNQESISKCRNCSDSF